ncbi:serine hydrolase [Balneolales bacterium ANBcel1]|nr:serine hydrolase [Balneolales bacterium ANBcel1]
MNRQELQDMITELANEFGVPGTAAGLWYRGEATYACHGVTSIENRLPVDVRTLFQAGSIGKTVTATALIILEADGRVNLEAPVRSYVPDLTVKDAAVGDEVTLLQLLNHTAGWEGDFFPDTGEGDDALARLVDRLNELEQLTRPGRVFSYNNAAFCLAGRVIEKVTGNTYESAIKSLILDPLGLRESFFFRDEVMTRRFAVGHKPKDDDTMEVARPWGLPRNGAAAGGLVSSIADLLAWGKFHLYGARHDIYKQQMPSKLRLDAMHEPTVHMPGCAFGDAFGIGWFLSKVGNAWLVSHGGSTHGQEASLSFLPEHDWAFALLTNSSPGGMALSQVATKRVLAACTGLAEEEMQPVSAAPSDLESYSGVYGARGMRCTVTVSEFGELVFTVSDEPELLALMSESAEVPQSEPTVLHASLASGDAGRYVFANGPLKGITGYFERDSHDRVQALHLFGRWLPRMRA